MLYDSDGTVEKLLYSHLDASENVQSSITLTSS